MCYVIVVSTISIVCFSFVVLSYLYLDYVDNNCNYYLNQMKSLLMIRTDSIMVIYFKLFYDFAHTAVVYRNKLAQVLMCYLYKHPIWLALFFWKLLSFIKNIPNVIFDRNGHQQCKKKLNFVLLWIFGQTYGCRKYFT